MLNVLVDVECSRLVAINSDVYNFKTWRGGEDYELNVLDGTSTSVSISWV
jgi:hypothetical protein